MLESVDIMKVCCFTGHRPNKLPWGYDEQDNRCEKLKNKVKQEVENLIQNGVQHFITGMALGFDMICAEVVLDLQKEYKNIKLYGAIPCSNQCERWNEKYIAKYEEIFSKLYDFRCKYVKYNQFCMQERNSYMVDHSYYVIALFDGTNGGTKNTVTYAKSKNKNIIIINPQDFN